MYYVSNCVYLLCIKESSNPKGYTEESFCPMLGRSVIVLCSIAFATKMTSFSSHFSNLHLPNT